MPSGSGKMRFPCGRHLELRRGTPSTIKYNVLTSVSGTQAAELPLSLQTFSLPTLKDVVEKLYRENYEGLYRYLVLSGSSEADARDFLQEGFVRLWECLKGGKRIERPRSWLIRVLHNTRVDACRLSSREVAYDSGRLPEISFRSESPSPEAELLKGERHHRLREAMRQLSPLQYQYLLLRAEGLKLFEIAEMYQVSIQAVADVCARATSRLGRSMNE
jgi:RNA polymerase sigma-70 factor (ECF subfamily)